MLIFVFLKVLKIGNFLLHVIISYLYRLYSKVIYRGDLNHPYIYRRPVPVQEKAHCLLLDIYLIQGLLLKNKNQEARSYGIRSEPFFLYFFNSTSHDTLYKK